MNSMGSGYVEERILAHGEQLWQEMAGEKPGLFDKDRLQGMLLDWVMRDPQFKVDLFRLIDVLPALNRNRQVAAHVREYLLRDPRELPVWFKTMLRLSVGTPLGPLFAGRMKSLVSRIGRSIIAAESPEAALPVLRGLHGEGFGFTADLLGEATTGEDEADLYQARYLKLLDVLAAELAGWPEAPLLERNHLGPLPRGNISIKVSSMDSQLDAIDPAGSLERLKMRILPLLRRARQHNIAVNFDLEQWKTHEITYALLEELLLHPDLRDWPHAGIVIQAYLKRAMRDFDFLLSLARKRQTPLHVRLVKGAYWDYETALALQERLPCPVWTRKEKTDAAFEHLSRLLLENSEYLQPAFASHNLRSLLNAVVQAEDLRLPRNAYEIQMLYGMAEPLRRALGSMETRLRLYVPIGELLPGMSYLVRRLLENTSNSGFLRRTYFEGANLKELLQKPDPRSEPPGEELPGTTIHDPFRNCPSTDFTAPDRREGFARSVEKWLKRLPLKIPIVVEGKKIGSERRHLRVSPNDTRITVAEISMASTEEVRRAVESAYRAWPEWRDRPLEERAGAIDRLADLLERDREELAALETIEAAKPWREADGDLAEAIDFCRFYARQALRELGERKQGDVPGEENVLFYEGRGPTAVIAPWNFPIAILCGMTSAALAAGNTVIIKPSPHSTALAHAFYQRLLKAGVPAKAAHFIPGYGKEAGAALVEHPLVAQIAFTGSKEVGLSIIEKAGRTLPGQPQVKRVVCEMGGKNAIIVDEDADLDDALLGVVRGAFGYAGQKCSACSRVILVGGLAERFILRLIEAVRSIKIDPAWLPSCGLGPVVDETAHRRLLERIDRPGEGAEVLFRGSLPPHRGYFVPPVLFEVKSTRHPLMQDELFGPLLTLYRVGDFEGALRAALEVEFALTGGVYSRSPRNIELARRTFRVGNLYLNRSCTGSIVERQPFGGFGMSGIGTKAGGPDYLLHFAQPRCVTENTMRRGFSPDME